MSLLEKVDKIDYFILSILVMIAGFFTLPTIFWIGLGMWIGSVITHLIKNVWSF